MSRLPTVDEVREIIRANVSDPEIGINIVDLGLVYNVDVQESDSVKSAEIEMTLTSPACPVGPQLISGVQTHIHEAFPVLDEINVHVVWNPLWSPDMMSEEARDQLGFF